MDSHPAAAHSQSQGCTPVVVEFDGTGVVEAVVPFGGIGVGGASAHHMPAQSPVHCSSLAPQYASK
jgi:hypothetical protein